MEGYEELENKLQRKLLMSLRDEKLEPNEYKKISRGLSSLLHYLELKDTNAI